MGIQGVDSGALDYAVSKSCHCRILLAGSYRYPWYEQACADALVALGHEVVRFSWSQYFSTVMGGFEEHFSLSGPATWRANRALMRLLAKHKVDALLLWRGVHLMPDVLRAIRRNVPTLALLSYNNDDPFGPFYDRSKKIHQRRLWGRFRSCIPEYDLNLVYRPINLAEFQAAGARNVRVLMPYFVPEVHRPLRLTSDEMRRYACDVVFVGHFENDDRVRYLRALARAGVKLRVFGNGWPPDVIAAIAPDLPPVYPVLGDEYAKALCGARLCLAFLSRVNRDTYTRRNFEIPACGRLMLSERTPDLLSLFTEDQEAVYFEGEEQLVQKVLGLLRNDAERESIAAAGLKRVWADGHDVTSRMRQMATFVAEAQLPSTP